MTIVLVRSDAHVRIPYLGWSALLALAHMNGWAPAGAVAPTGATASYNCPRGQVVTANDAVALADALEAGLDDIPDFEAIPTTGERRATPIEVWSGHRKPRLTGLLPFLRSGPFALFGACARHGS